MTQFATQHTCIESWERLLWLASSETGAKEGGIALGAMPMAFQRMLGSNSMASSGGLPDGGAGLPY